MSAPVSAHPPQSHLAWDVFNSSPIATLVFERSTGDIVDANRIARQILGTSRRRLRSLRLGQLAGLEHEVALLSCAAALDDGTHFPEHPDPPPQDIQPQELQPHCTIPLQRANGTRFWARITVAALDSTTTYALATIVDVESLVIENRSDPLTGLATRDVLEPAIDAALHTAAASVAVLFVDIDHFKDINDSMGHPVGDQLLQQVAIGLRAATRATDLVARYGGDEFVIVLPGVTTERRLQMIADAIRNNISVAGEELAWHAVERDLLTASIGIAVANHDRCDPSELLVAADAAMYQAKRAGGDCAVLQRLSVPQVAI